mmetsp:Transcript_2665/g.5507  ORF Transcript_2665/g.5507 Transcript_2665/m.5507 type:complete len:310 (+) Transcript_2665:108-1037(+)
MMQLSADRRPLWWLLLGLLSASVNDCRRVCVFHFSASSLSPSSAFLSSSPLSSHPSPYVRRGQRVPSRTVTLKSATTAEEGSATSTSTAVEVEESFIKGPLRKAAMKLHTRDQSKEGEQKAQTPVKKWDPTLADYLQFLVDSQHVYAVLEDLVGADEALSSLRNTGLERREALEKDVVWITEEFAPSKGVQLTRPEVASPGKEYAETLQQAAKESIPRFVNHFYNFYFAHTAGGRMIGKRMAELLLDGETLKFYQWEGDVKALLERTSGAIDALARSWTESERQACVDETAAAFKGGGAVLSHLSPKQQ